MNILGFMTLMIGVITSYIAYQQWQTNKQKFILDRYDRRFKVYDEVQKFIRIIFQEGKPSNSDLINFQSATLEADFLFGPEISEYIEEIRAHGMKLQTWKNEYKDNTQKTPDGYDPNKVVNGISTESEWFSNQLESAKRKFKKYLDVCK